MAFNLEGFGRVSSTQNSKSNVQWSYKSTTDTIATILVDGYFDPVGGRLLDNSRIIVEGSDDTNSLVVSGLSPVKTESSLAQSATFTGAITGVITGTATIHLVKVKNCVTWLLKTSFGNPGGGPGALDIDGTNFPVDFLPGTNNSPLYTVQVDDDGTGKIGVMFMNGVTGQMQFSSGPGIFDTFAGAGPPGSTGWFDLNGSYVIKDI